MDRNDPKFYSELYEKVTMLMEYGYEIEEKLDDMIDELWDLKHALRKGNVDA